MRVCKIAMQTSAFLYLPCGPRKGAGGEALAKCLCWGYVVRSVLTYISEKCAICHTPLFNQIQYLIPISDLEMIITCQVTTFDCLKRSIFSVQISQFASISVQKSRSSE